MDDRLDARSVGGVLQQHGRANDADQETQNLRYDELKWGDKEEFKFAIRPQNSTKN